MKQTENYQLNQWEAADRILMEDFNSDNAKLDAALAGLAAGKADSAAVSGLSGTVSSLSAAVSQKAEAAALAAETDARTSAVSAINTQLTARGNCQIYYGTYTGDGATSRTLTFPHKPLLVIIMAGNLILRAMRGVDEFMCRTNGDGGEVGSAVWSGNSLTWSGIKPVYLCNYAGGVYAVVALMDVTDQTP